MRRQARISRTPIVWNKRPNPRRAPDHHDFVKLLPCLACGCRGPCDPAHLRFNAADAEYKGAAGMQPHDRQLVPLCRRCHMAEENKGKLTFWGEVQSRGITDPVQVAARLWAISGDLEQGYRAIIRARPGLVTAMIESAPQR